METRELGQGKAAVKSHRDSYGVPGADGTFLPNAKDVQPTQLGP